MCWRTGGAFLFYEEATAESLGGLPERGQTHCTTFAEEDEDEGEVMEGRSGHGKGLSNICHVDEESQKCFSCLSSGQMLL